MLTLTRKPSEAIILRVGEIEIRIVGKIKSGRIKYGIEAPEEVKVLRGELVEKAA